MVLFLTHRQFCKLYVERSHFTSYLKDNHSYVKYRGFVFGLIFLLPLIYLLSSRALGGYLPLSVIPLIAALILSLHCRGSGLYLFSFIILHIATKPYTGCICVSQQTGTITNATFFHLVSAVLRIFTEVLVVVAACLKRSNMTGYLRWLSSKEV